MRISDWSSDVCSSDLIANTLEAEHRIIDVERDHDPVVRRIRRGCRNPGTEAAGFVYTLLQQLPIGRFLVVHALVFIDRRVLLAFWRVNADLAEQPFHAESARFVLQSGDNTQRTRLVATDLI